MKPSKYYLPGLFAARLSLLHQSSRLRFPIQTTHCIPYALRPVPSLYSYDTSLSDRSGSVIPAVYWNNFPVNRTIFRDWSSTFALGLLNRTLKLQESCRLHFFDRYSFTSVVTEPPHTNECNCDRAVRRISVLTANHRAAACIDYGLGGRRRPLSLPPSSSAG